MDDQWIQLALLSLFPLIGGLVAGWSFRQGFTQGWSCNLVPRIFWALVYSLIPIAIGLFVSFSKGTPLLALVGPLVFLIALLASLLIPGWFLESFSTELLFPVFLGGALMLAGIVMFPSVASSSFLTALFVLAIFEAVGGVMVVTGVIRVIKS